MASECVDKAGGGSIGAAHLSTRTCDQVFLEFEEEGQQLLPGILDDITVDLISPKLPWKTLNLLALVSRGWRQAIRSGQVYDARSRSHSTDTLVVINHFVPGKGHAISLFSVRDQSLYQLPQIPNIEIPWFCRCISMDGKIYVVGRGEVYVMDLARQSRWVRCASMMYIRENFAAGVVDGKVYASGGRNGAETVRVAEVYDPKFDIWHPVRSHTSSRYEHQITTIGEKAFMHGGRIAYDANQSTRKLDFAGDNLGPGRNCQTRAAFFLDVFHPGRDEWRTTENFEKKDQWPRDTVFAARGQLHALGTSGIHVYDLDTNSWTHRHSFRFHDPTIKDLIRASYPFTTWFAVGVDNELVTILQTFSGGLVQGLLLRSNGFGGEDKTIVFEEVDSPVEIGYTYSICALHL